MATLVFTDHARFQMRERHITETKVRLCVRSPDKTIHQTARRQRFVKLFRKSGGQYAIIAICDIMPPNTRKIVTVFITSKIRKYL